MNAIPRPNVVILGAGASKGAMLGASTPPLDADFLKTARKALSRRGPGDADTNAWRRFVSKLKNAGLKPETFQDWRLEQLSTYLEARANMPALQAKAGRPANYKNALDALNQIICRTLARTNGTKMCPLHVELFKTLRPSSVVTFNYDLLADQSLCSLGWLPWWMASYAGSAIQVLGARGKPYNRARPKRRNQDHVPLLKLHGSMNWSAHLKGGGFYLATPSFPTSSIGYDGPPNKPMVVPPVAAKMDIRKGALRQLWKDAAYELRKARCWVIWGYSFPTTDTVTQVLCRTALSKNRRPKRIIIINPDHSVVKRVKEALDAVRVEHWVSMERFLLDAGVELPRATDREGRSR